MNTTSTLVGLSLMGAAAPSMMNMTLAPIVAQKRAQNFTQAETLAVTFAAEAEATQSLPSIPEGCAVSDPENSVYTISCTSGANEFDMRATRAFRILDEIDDGGSGGRNFPYETPKSFSNIQCPVGDEWGVNQENAKRAAQGKNACKPWVLWSSFAYRDSNPDSWLFDVNNHNGWGDHEDY